MYISFRQNDAHVRVTREKEDVEIIKVSINIGIFSALNLASS